MSCCNKNNMIVLYNRISVQHQVLHKSTGKIDSLKESSNWATLDPVLFSVCNTNITTKIAYINDRMYHSIDTLLHVFAMVYSTSLIHSHLTPPQIHHKPSNAVESELVRYKSSQYILYMSSDSHRHLGKANRGQP